jgi:hypothetical protein
MYVLTPKPEGVNLKSHGLNFEFIEKFQLPFHLQKLVLLHENPLIPVQEAFQAHWLSKNVFGMVAEDSHEDNQSM